MGGDKSVINLLYIMAAVDAHKKLGWEPSGSRTVGFDVADNGGDKNAIVDAHGNVVVGAQEWAGLEDELLKSSARTWNYAREVGAPKVTYDSIGVGAQAGAKFAELNEANSYPLEYDAFNAGGAIDDPEGVFMQLPHKDILNKDHFSNLKAQKWAEVATRFRKTYEVIVKGAKHPFDELISLDSESLGQAIIEQLQMELSAPRKDTDGNGRFKVESKKDLAKRDIKSPNVADALLWQ